MDIHQYNKEADDIDEIQEEYRQERMKKQKKKACYIRFKRWKESLNAEKASQEEKIPKDKRGWGRSYGYPTSSKQNTSQVKEC